MQATDSVTGDAYTWLTFTPDWNGSEYPGPNDPENVFVITKTGSSGGGEDETTFQELGDEDTTIESDDGKDWVLPIATLTEPRTVTLSVDGMRDTQERRFQRLDATEFALTFTTDGTLDETFELETGWEVVFKFSAALGDYGIVSQRPL